MLTKKQKSRQIEEGKKLVEESRFLLFVDFSGTSVEDLKKLRRSLLALGAKLKVFKKKLLRVILNNLGFNFNPEQFDFQVGTIFSTNDISEVAGLVYKFSKLVESKEFKILGSYDLSAKNFLDAETIKKIGQLPSREILLAQLAGMLAMPIKMFMNVLNEKVKRS